MVFFYIYVCVCSLELEPRLCENITCVEALNVLFHTYHYASIFPPYYLLPCNSISFKWCYFWLILENIPSPFNYLDSF